MSDYRPRVCPFCFGDSFVYQDYDEWECKDCCSIFTTVQSIEYEKEVEGRSFG